MKENEKTSVFPEEMPAGENKKLNHGVIVDVVKSELCPPSATTPVKPADTDSINTEFAKQAQQNKS